MSSHCQPIIDLQNPLYCPSISANVYINQVLLPTRNQRSKSRLLKNKKSPMHRTAPVSSFLRMLGHWIEAKQRRSGLSDSPNDCLDSGIPSRVQDDEVARRPTSRNLAARHRGPLTRAQARMLDDEEYVSIDFKSPGAVSSPKLPALSVQSNTYRVARGSSDSKVPLLPLWNTSGSSDSTTLSSSPTFLIASSASADFSPPGLGNDHKRFERAATTAKFGLAHPSTSRKTGSQSQAAETLARFDKPRSGCDAQPSITKYKSRKRKLEELFPELLKLKPEDRGTTKRHKRTWDTLLLTDEENDTLNAVGFPRRSFLYGRKMMPSPVSTGEVSNTKKIGADQRIKVLEDALYGQPIGTESPRGYKILLDKLDAMMPGIRLRERLSEITYSSNLLPLPPQAPDVDGSQWGRYWYANGRGTVREQSHQGVADFLGEQGLLNERVMEMLRTSEIRRLEMAPTLADEGGLNLGGRDALQVFSKPNSFLFLTDISFSGVPVHDADLLHLIRLPKLRRLWLEDTKIGDEAIYHLTGLRATLCTLSLASNPRISDDSVPALILLAKLQFLSLIGTGIGMVGLRKLASVVNRERRVIDVEIPEKCELYVANLESNARYLLNIQPPLISIPSLCDQLSIGALKRNLEAHLTVAAIRVQPPVAQSQFRLHGASASGTAVNEISDFMTKEEMRERLRSILRMREVDLLVKGMIFG